MLEFRLDLDKQRLFCNDESRPVTEADWATVTDFFALGDEEGMLGTHIYAWLNGSQAWLDRLAAQDDMSIASFTLDPPQDEAQREVAQLFLDVPWEQTRPREHQGAWWLVIRKLPEHAAALEIPDCDVFQRVSGDNQKTKSLLLRVAENGGGELRSCLVMIQKFLAEGHDVKAEQTQIYIQNRCLEWAASGCAVAGDMEKSLRLNCERLEYVKQLDDPRQHANCLVMIASHYFALAKFSEGAHCFYQAHALLKDEPYLLEGAAVLERFATKLFRHDKFEEALVQQQAALVMYRQSGNLLAYANGLLGLTAYHFTLDQDDAAFEASQEALAIYRAAELPELEENIVSCQMNLGRVHWQRGEYDQAVAIFEEAAARAKACDFMESYYLCLMTLLTLGFHLQDRPKIAAVAEALKTFHRELGEDTGDENQPLAEKVVAVMALLKQKKDR